MACQPPPPVAPHVRLLPLCFVVSFCCFSLVVLFSVPYLVCVMSCVLGVVVLLLWSSARACLASLRSAREKMGPPPGWRRGCSAVPCGRLELGRCEGWAGSGWGWGGFVPGPHACYYRTVFPCLYLSRIAVVKFRMCMCHVVAPHNCECVLHVPCTVHRAFH